MDSKTQNLDRHRHRGGALLYFTGRFGRLVRFTLTLHRDR